MGQQNVLLDVPVSLPSICTLTAYLMFVHSIPSITALIWDADNHPHQTKYSQMRIRNSSRVIRFVREALENPSDEMLDVMIGAVEVLASEQTAVRSRRSYGHCRFKSPLAQAQYVEMNAMPVYPRAHMNALKYLVGLRGGLDRIASADVAATIQV